ncbi:unnamed protein product [Protopolystoma xenopodis]|uniref:Uncharacterized protein n=1 Tax=Protopolystoma xenopodis TaxID=117903 RepID=A0A448XSW5_9PLAT|nr:unnamed protein product [Protopolystoma xenopodis]
MSNALFFLFPFQPSMKADGKPAEETLEADPNHKVPAEDALPVSLALTLSLAPFLAPSCAPLSPLRSATSDLTSSSCCRYKTGTLK